MMMAQSSSRPVVVSETFSSVGRNEAQSSGVSWPAVAAGAFVAAALSLILLSLGTGLGFSAVSPWPNSGASAAAVGGGAIVWLIFTQIAASALGGYLGGRLRTKWTNVHTDEVYFRDTAHGLLVWAVGMVISRIPGLFNGIFRRCSEEHCNGHPESGFCARPHFVLRGHFASRQQLGRREAECLRAS